MTQPDDAQDIARAETRPLPDRDTIAQTLAKAYGDDLPTKYADLFDDLDLKAADAVLELLKGELDGN